MHPNAELIRSGYEAFAAGDVPAVLERFAPDIRWHIPGRSGLAGTYKGHDEVVGFFGKIFELSGGTFALELHDVIASDDHVVALATASMEKDGRRESFKDVHVWHVVDGKATEFWGASPDQYAFDEFWGS